MPIRYVLVDVLLAVSLKFRVHLAASLRCGLARGGEDGPQGGVGMAISLQWRLRITRRSKSAAMARMVMMSGAPLCF